MIKWCTGDLLADDADALVNPVNCVGAMGKGLAKAFADKYPNMLRHYQHACRYNLVETGVMHLYTGMFKNPGDPDIINFPTKDHWRNPSKISYIQDGLNNLLLNVDFYEWKSIATVPLGCGLGGLDWATVRPLIVAAAESRPEVEWRIYGSQT